MCQKAFCSELSAGAQLLSDPGVWVPVLRLDSEQAPGSPCCVSFVPSLCLFEP